MQIQGNYELDIFIDGLNLLAAPGAKLIEANILESFNNPIPCCILKMSVPLGWINQR